MDPHLLRTFVTVTRLGSFSAAADELGYTQSAVSQQVAALETDLGTPLLNRRPVMPTPAGQRLLEHAEPLLLRHRAARADVLRAAAGPPRRVVVAASPLACPPWLARRLRGPRLETTLRTVSRRDVAEQVASGAAEVGLLDGIAAPSDPLRLPDVGPLTAVGMAEERLMVVLPAGHPLARRRGLALADLAGALWLQAPAAAAVERLRAVAGLPAGQEGFRIGFRYEGHDLRTVVSLVAAGHGLTLLPASALEAGQTAGQMSGQMSGQVMGQATAGPGAVGVPLTEPRVVHRVEVLHGPLRGPLAALVSELTASPAAADPPT
ncbi:LysR family transcriptional regulator [Planobispora longispora]|uniref:LysR family transcriptional regulator n=1 Tax=Planobispora longispora TaxID=28887 RepID=A0A8J3RLY2_9ACTN|nr:LysR family transcriptional regulator [Planobispora longispora]BFE79586.1 LysR family transcriptional regulator [Planobispora longispora]GIH78112.1 LysR family transcriptional regulator [Planobispora longispora]